MVRARFAGAALSLVCICVLAVSSGAAAQRPSGARSPTLAQVLRLDTLRRASVDAMMAGKLDTAVSLADAAVNFALSIGDRSVAQLRAYTGRVEFQLARRLGAAGDLGNAGAHALRAAELGLAGGDSVLGTWPAADTGFVYFRKFAAQLASRGRRDSAVAALDEALKMAHAAERARSRVAFWSMTAPATFARAKLRAVDGDWSLALADYRSMWASRDSLDPRLRAYAAIGIGAGHFALGRADSALFYWSHPGRSDVYYSGLSCAADAQRARDAVYLAALEVRTPDTTVMRLIDGAASEVADSGRGPPADQVDQIPPFPALLTVRELGDETTRAYLRAMPVLGRERAVGAAMIAKEATVRHATLDSLNAAGGRRLGHPYVDIRVYPRPCSDRIIGAEELSGASSEIIDRIQSRGQTALAYRRVRDSLAVFLISRSGDLLEETVGFSAPPSAPSSQPDSLRRRFIPATIAPFVPDTGTIIIVRDTALVGVPFDRMLPNVHIVLADLLADYAVALGPSVAKPTAAIAAATSRAQPSRATPQAAPVAACRLPATPVVDDVTTLRRAITPSDSLRAYSTTAYRLFSDLLRMTDSLSQHVRDSVLRRLIAPTRDSAFAAQEFAAAAALKASDTLAAARLLLGLGLARAERANDWREKQADTWRAGAARALATSADLSARSSARSTEYRALEALAEVTSDDDSVLANARQRSRLAKQLGDRAAEARALVALGKLLPSNAAERHSAYTRASRLAFDEPDYAEALASLPPNLASQLETLIPWDDALDASFSSLFGVPSSVPNLHRMALRLAASGDTSNAARLLDAVAAIFQARITKFTVDSAMLDSARQTLRAAHTLRLHANDGAGLARTLMRMAAVEGAVATDSVKLASVVRLVDSAAAVAARGNAIGVAARARRTRALLAPPRDKNGAPLIGALLPLSTQAIRGGDTALAAEILTQIASLHASNDRLDSAVVVLRSATALARQKGDARLAGNLEEQLSFLWRAVGRPDSAVTSLQASVGHAAAVGEESTAMARELELADALSAAGQPSVARTLLRSGLDRSMQIPPHDKSEADTRMSLVGRLYAQLGRDDSAAAMFSRAVSTSAPREHLTSWATILLRSGCLDSANTVVQAAFSAAQGPIPDRIAVARMLEVVADLELRARSRIDSAIQYRGWASAIWQRAHVDTAAARDYTQISRLYDQIQRSDSAAFFADLARRSGGQIIAGASSSVTVQRSRADSIQAAHDRGDPMEEARLLVADADRQRATSVDQASDEYQRATHVLAALMRGSPSESNRIALASRLEQVYEHWSLALLTEAPRLGMRPSMLIALALADRGRGQVLQDIRQTTQADNDSLIQRFASLNGVRRDSMIQISSVMPDTNVDDAGLAVEGERLLGAGGLEAQVLSYLLADDTLVVWLKSYRNGAYEIAAAPPRRVRRDSIAGLVRAVRDQLGVDGILTRAGTRPETKERARGLVAGLVGDSVKLRAALGALSNVLLPAEIARVLSPTGELVVIPHGILGVVPFAALTVPRDTQPLGARFAIRYGPSLAAVAEIEFANTGAMISPRRWRQPALSLLDGRGTPYRDSLAWRRSALVLGAPTLPKALDGFSLGPLDSAESEARTIAGLFGVQPLVGRQASEQELRARMSTATVIHLATHGVAFANPSDSRKSFVALAASRNAGSAGDGVLTVSELVDERAIHTEADLVVLSACQTGFGDFNAAEGVLGLQRAFLAKGALSVIGSLWSVDDEATNALMTAFYRHWLSDTDKPSKALALQRAQQAVRTDKLHKAWSNPRYWAAFQLVGAD